MHCLVSFCQKLAGSYKLTTLVRWLGLSPTLLGTRVEAEWLSCKNLQVSGRNLQGDASPCKFFFQKLASSYKITLRLASSYKLTLRLASSYKLTIRLTRLLQVNHSHTHTPTHTTHAHTRTHTHTYTLSLSLTHTHIHTYTHAHTHTHTHIRPKP